ncbi:MAG: transporter substrate-binding domain-containing protein, partial [Desulfobacterales bacterium]|nr:transporter substrate-binding domain-containing protein [Desulfobacterales bacterium]
MKNFWSTISSAASLLILTASLTAAAADELTVVYNGGSAPLTFEDATSRPAGLLPDLWQLWAQKAGRKIKFVKVESVEASLQLLQDDKADLHAGLTRTPEREKVLDYSEPLLTLDYHIFTHPSVYPIKSLEKTSGLLVGIRKGGYTEKLVRANVPANRIVVYDRLQDLFRAALEGEIKVFVATELSLLYFLKENYQTNIFEFDRDRQLFSQVYYTATKKGNPVRIQEVNDGLKAIGSEERKQLESKWTEKRIQVVPQASKVALPGDEMIALTDEERQWLASHKKIVVGGEMDWAPFDFVDETGAYAGLANDYLKIIGEKLGIEVEMITGPPWDELLAMIRRQEIDVLPAIYHSEERESYVNFTTPYLKITEFIFARSDNQAISTFTDLKEKTTVVVSGYTIENYLRSNYPDYALITAPTIQDALKKLIIGEADAFIGDIISTSYNIKELSLVGIKPIASVSDEGPMVHMAVRKDWPILRNLIDKTLKAIPAGKRDAIADQWISFAENKIVQSRAKVILTAEEQNWINQHPVIRVHNEKDWPPFNYFEYGTPRGLSIDYMNQVAEKLGIKIEYVTGPSWNEFLGMIQRKELDVMLNIVKTEDRLKYLLYTEPYIKNPNVIVSSEDNPYETIEALLDKTVAFPKGFFYEEVLTKSFPRIKRLPVENTLASLKAVTFGRADAALGEAAVVRTLISKNLLTGLRISGEVSIGNPDLANLRIGVRNDWPLLQSALMKAMAAITPQAMDQIRQKWFLVDSSPTARKTDAPISYDRLIIYGLAVFVVLSLLTWILIKFARKEQLAVSFGSRWFRGLVLAGLSFFVIVVCLLGWYTLDKNREQTLTAVGEDLSETLITANDRLNFWVEKRISSLKLLGRHPELVTLVKRLLALTPDSESLLSSDALRDTRDFFKNNEDVFSNLGFFIINTDNISIGSMRDTNIGTPNLISLQRPDLLRRAFAGNVLFVPPIESDVPLGKGLRADGTRNPSTKFFIGPVRGSSGQIIAVMTLRVDPARDFSQLLVPSVMHQTGEIYAFSEQGEMLSESRFGGLLRRIGLIGEDQPSALNVAIRDPGVNLVAGQRPPIERSRQPLTRMASHALLLKADMAKAGQTTGRSKIEIDTGGYRDYRGVPVYGAWLWDADLDLGLAAEIDVAEAMSDYYQLRRTVFWVLGFTLVLSVGAVLLVLILGERTSHALIRARDNLEATVDQRTAELQENQKQLEAAVERSGLILDSAGEGIFGVDLEGKVAFINPAANRMLGYGPDELIGQEVHAKIHHSHGDGTDYPKEQCPMYQTYIDGTDHYVSDEVLWRKDGTPFPVEYTSMPIKKNGRVVGAVVTFMDIAERKEMEDALLAERERLQKILDTSPVGVGISTEGVVRFANPQFSKLFFSQEGESAREAYVNPKDREYIVKELERSG